MTRVTKIAILLINSVVVFSLGYFAHDLIEFIDKKMTLEKVDKKRNAALDLEKNDLQKKLSLKKKMLEYRQFSLALNNPSVTKASEAKNMDDDDTVTGIVVNGHARAYPWWIVLNYHVVNDIIDETPLLLTLCEACGASSAFSAQIDSEFFALEFSNSFAGLGFGTFKIEDHNTKSVWHPFLGLCLSGPLKGRKLQRIPTQLAKWKDWKRAHPQTEVLLASMDLRESPHALSGSRTIGESTMSEDLKKVSNLTDPRLPLHSIILGVNISSEAQTLGTKTAQGKAYPMKTVEKHGGIIHDNISGKDIIVVKISDMSLKGFYVKSNQSKSFFKIASRDPFIFKDQTGNLFDEWGYPLNNPEHTPLLTIDAYVTEWYEWVSAFPGSEIFLRTRL